MWGDEGLRFTLPWVKRAWPSDWEEDEIVANCSWLRKQASGVYALKTHELRSHAGLRQALRTCVFPPLLLATEHAEAGKGDAGDAVVRVGWTEGLGS